jgi:hypothetical protein
MPHRLIEQMMSLAKMVGNGYFVFSAIRGLRSWPLLRQDEQRVLVCISGTVSNAKQPSRADAATMLLPGPQQAHTQLDLAIRVLNRLAFPSSTDAMSKALATARVQRALAAFGHPAADP